MSFRKPCHMPFHKHIPPFTLTGVRHNQKAVIKVVEASNVINDPKCNKGPKCNNFWP